VVLDEVVLAGAGVEQLRAARGGGEADPLHLGGDDLHGQVGADLGRLLVEPVAGRLLRAGRGGAVVR